MAALLGAGGARAAEVVDLRGYGHVQAAITSQRSEFVCENADKADLLLGKLLADLFWDAGADHTVSTVKLGARDAVVHQWPPYGALIAGRNGNRVVVVGGQNSAEVVDRAQRRYQLFGKYLPARPQLALLISSASTLLGNEGHSFADWDLGRGELQASHYDNVYVTESMLAQGLADDYPVLFDSDTLTVSPDTLAALRRYVEKGGTFIATQNSGRQALLEPDAWPISDLTGFKVLGVGKHGTITFEKNLPIFHGWEGKQFEGEGSALDWKDTQSARHVSVGLAPQAADAVALARWEDGSVAVGMRTIGKGRVIVLGSTFWRYGRDLGGSGMWRTDHVEPVFLERLFTDLGVQRTDDASTPEVYTRKVITKNGLQEWLIAMNTANLDRTADLSFTVSAPPAAVWDMNEKAPVPFTSADGWVQLKDVALSPYGTRIFGVQRASLAGGVDFWWREKTKFWTRRAPLTPAVTPPPEDPAHPPAIAFDTWRFYPDQDDAVSKTATGPSPALPTAPGAAPITSRGISSSPICTTTAASASIAAGPLHSPRPGRTGGSS